MSLLDTVLGQSKVYVMLACAVTWILMRMLAGWADVPTFEDQSVSLLVTPGTFRALTVIVFGYVLCLLVAHAICFRWSRTAGWACATFGLAAVSMRGGPLGEQLLGREPGVFLVLFVELLLLGVLVAAGWWASIKLVGPEPGRGVGEPLDQKGLALATTTVIGVILVMLIARTDAKMQALMAALLAGLGGAWIAHQFIETRPSAWFWGGPLVIGGLGYLAAWLMTGEAALQVGQPGGFFAALARVAPLDYASFGVAGGAAGYAMSRQKHAERRAEQQPPDPHPKPTPPTEAAV